MKGRFSQIIIIGCGKIAGDVLGFTADKRAEYGFSLAFIEHEKHAMSKFESMCKEMCAQYEQIPEKSAITEKLMQINEPTLVISAGNYYLFPAEVVAKSELEIINFHNALLPAYPGRNAQSWAIFMGEKFTGATWHYVSAQVDSGAIIAQEKVEISEDTKAYELTKSIMDTAFKLFAEFFEQLLERHIDGTPQPKVQGKRKIYYSYDIPGNGVCNINDNPESIYRLLRSMDYGKSDIFPPVQIVLSDGTKAQVLRYSRKENVHTNGQNYVLDSTDHRLYLPLSAGTELVIRLK